MPTTAILYPLFAMVLLTYLVAGRMLKLRYRAVLQDGLSPHYFSYNRGGEPPEYLLRVTQHYDNLFEVPILFYLAIVVTYSTELTDLTSVILAWLFVMTRLAHSYVHIFINTLKLRRQTFLLGSLVLFIIWVKLFVQLMNIE